MTICAVRGKVRTCCAPASAGKDGAAGGAAAVLALPIGRGANRRIEVSDPQREAIGASMFARWRGCGTRE